MQERHYRIAIALMGKGSTNHLHRAEVVDGFMQHGISITFLVREDYFDLLEPLEHCVYQKVVFQPLRGWRALLKTNLEYIRNLYPSQDPGRKSYFGMMSKYKRSMGFRLVDCLYRYLARFQTIMKVIIDLEGLLKLHDEVTGVDCEAFDQMLLLGVGTASSEFEGHLVWWAKDKKIPVVNIVGNYDNLTSKGFRGVPVERLLVWGPNMRDDAIKFHGIEEHKITEIGSLRYNISFRSLRGDRSTFLSSLGLDPAKKTILFAGFFYEFHYFEMIEVFKQLRRDRGDCQLILRIYPNKILMSSVFMTPLLEYASIMEGVFVSIADPNYNKGEKGRAVLQIEEFELTNALYSCDCVVNIFSTISLEACICDKPAINMYYFPEDFPALARAPRYYEYDKFFHSRRLVSYGAITTTRNRVELVAAINVALDQPEEGADARKKTVQLECGSLDGKACERLVAACQAEIVKNR